MRNDSFISGFSKFVEKLSQFKSLESSYLDDVKSKFRNELSDISKKVTFLFDKMEEAGKIKLSVSHGTALFSPQKRTSF